MRDDALETPPDEGFVDLVEPEEQGKGGQGEVVVAATEMPHRVDTDGGDDDPAD